MVVVSFGFKSHALVSEPKCGNMIRVGTTKVAKPIRVQLAQGAATSTYKVVFRAILECGKAKFTKHFTIYALDGIEAILMNIFLNHLDLLKGGSKLKVIVKLVDRFVNLKVEY
jgi:hypothetical protein